MNNRTYGVGGGEFQCTVFFSHGVLANNITKRIIGKTIVEGNEGGNGSTI